MNLNPFIELVADILGIYSWVMAAAIILQLLLHFDMVNRNHPVMQKLHYALFKMTEPVLRPVRNILPDLGGIDISPIVIFLLIRFIRSVLFTYFYVY